MIEHKTRGKSRIRRKGATGLHTRLDRAGLDRKKGGWGACLIWLPGLRVSQRGPPSVAPRRSRGCSWPSTSHSTRRTTNETGGFSILAAPLSDGAAIKGAGCSLVGRGGVQSVSPNRGRAGIRTKGDIVTYSDVSDRGAVSPTTGYARSGFEGLSDGLSRCCAKASRPSSES